jgi:hypothetical protein
METLTKSQPDVAPPILPPHVEAAMTANEHSSNDIVAIMDEALGVVQPTEQAEVEKQSRIKRFGRAILGKGLVEGFGTVWDVASIAAGLPLPVREAAGGVADMYLYDKVAPNQHDGEPKQETMKRKAGKMIGGAVTAIAAQKLGPGVVEQAAHHLHFASGLDHEAIKGYALPITSKFGAMSGVNAAQKSLSSRRIV